MPSLRDVVAGHLIGKRYDDVLGLARKDKRTVRTLMGLLYHEEELVRWRAVTMFGQMAVAEPGLVAPFIFRLLWSLNEESSVVGWCSAQALGEIARRNPDLTKDAIRVVLHFLDDEEVSLPANRNTYLLAGSIWAIGNLADAEPALVGEMGPALVGFLDDPEPQIRALSAWALGEMRFKASSHGLERLKDDQAKVEIYLGDELVEETVGMAAAKALEKIAGP